MTALFNKINFLTIFCHSVYTVRACTLQETDKLTITYNFYATVCMWIIAEPWNGPFPASLSYMKHLLIGSFEIKIKCLSESFQNDKI